MTSINQEKKDSVLSKKLIRKCYINWMCFNLSLYQPETMQAPALVKMFGDIREDLYPGDKQKQQELIQTQIKMLQAQLAQLQRQQAEETQQKQEQKQLRAEGVNAPSDDHQIDVYI